MEENRTLDRHWRVESIVLMKCSVTAIILSCSPGVSRLPIKTCNDWSELVNTGTTQISFLSSQGWSGQARPATRIDEDFLSFSSLDWAEQLPDTSRVAIRKPTNVPAGMIALEDENSSEYKVDQERERRLNYFFLQFLPPSPSVCWLANLI